MGNGDFGGHCRELGGGVAAEPSMGAAKAGMGREDSEFPSRCCACACLGVLPAGCECFARQFTKDRVGLGGGQDLPQGRSPDAHSRGHCWERLHGHLKHAEPFLVSGLCFMEWGAIVHISRPEKISQSLSCPQILGHSGAPPALCSQRSVRRHGCPSTTSPGSLRARRSNLHVEFSISALQLGSSEY